MRPSVRKAVLGILAGAAASAPLVLNLGRAGASVAVGAVIGMIYAGAFAFLSRPLDDEAFLAAVRGDSSNENSDFAGLTVPSLDRQGWDLLWNWRKI